MFSLIEEQLKEVSNGIIFSLIAGLGGGVAYLSSIFGNRKKFVFLDFFIKVVSSAFAGLLIGWVLNYYEYPISIICSVTGTAGYIGADFTVNFIKRIIVNRANLLAPSDNSNQR